jgi:hypothetical protein
MDRVGGMNNSYITQTYGLRIDASYKSYLLSVVHIMFHFMTFG